MTENNPGNGEFNISPKPIENFTSRTIWTGRVQRQVRDAMFSNVKEIEPSLDLEMLQKGLGQVGEGVIARMASVATRMGWQMDRPEMVYLSASYIANQANQKANYIHRYLVEAEVGFKHSVGAQTKRNRADQLEESARKVFVARDRFAQVTISRPQDYLQILEALARNGVQEMGNQKNRDEIFEALKDNRLVEVYASLIALGLIK